MANIASFEGYSGALLRWQIENITLLSDGHDKQSNLEKSITLSLTSPRVSSSPHAKNLLSLLSLLPDGIKAENPIAGHVPIPDVRSAQALLIGTSLAYLNPKGRLTALSPIREYIRRSHPSSLSISRPLRVYFQELLELFRLTQELSSDNLSSELVGNLGNIHQLMLEGLITEDKSSWASIGCSILILNTFSRIMLKGTSPLHQRVPHLIAATGDVGLRWKYRSAWLSNPDRRQLLNEDFEIWIKDGVEYFGTGIRPIELAVSFYEAVAYHYTFPQFFNLQKAKEFCTLASALAQDAHEIKLQLLSLKAEYVIAHRCGDLHRQLNIVHKARDLMRFASDSSLGVHWIQNEAVVNFNIGNMPRALDLCAQGEDILVSSGMHGSDRHLALLDIRAAVHFQKTEYEEARQRHEEISKETSSTSSPLFYANSLASIAQLDVVTERPVAGILANLHAAEAIWQGLGTSNVSFVTAELKLYCGIPRTPARNFYGV
ncbi:hypothetical protein K438DRAFT_1975087 [Mycena galopus ATCC 62051]|nr:hypothetical protein K438DRAFT_1975087 [Mycena galopus ATCC 62051]